MSYCESIVAMEYYDGPMSGVGFRSSDGSAVYFKVVAWDYECWERIFAVCPVSAALVDEFCEKLVKANGELKKPFWLPDFGDSAVDLLWIEIQKEARASEHWSVVSSQDLLGNSSVHALSAPQSVCLRKLVEGNQIVGLVGTQLKDEFMSNCAMKPDAYL